MRRLPPSRQPEEDSRPPSPLGPRTTALRAQTPGTSSAKGAGGGWDLGTLASPLPAPLRRSRPAGGLWPAARPSRTARAPPETRGPPLPRSSYLFAGAALRPPPRSASASAAKRPGSGCPGIPPRPRPVAQVIPGRGPPLPPSVPALGRPRAPGPGHWLGGTSRPCPQLLSS